MPAITLASILGNAGRRLLERIIDRARQMGMANPDPIYISLELWAMQVLNEVDLQAVFYAAQQEFSRANTASRQDRHLETFTLILQHGGDDVGNFAECLWLTYVYQLHNAPETLWRLYPRLVRQAMLATDVPLPRMWGDWVIPIQIFMDIVEQMLVNDNEPFRLLVTTVDLASLLEDGTTRPVTGNAVPVTDPQLSVAAVLGSYLDGVASEIGHIDARGYLDSDRHEIPTSEVYARRHLISLDKWIKPPDYVRYEIATYEGPYYLDRAPLVDPEPSHWAKIESSKVTIHDAIKQHQALLVLGEIGGGKTMLLRHTLLEYVNNLRDRDLQALEVESQRDGEVYVRLSHPLPVYIDLPRFVDERESNESLSGFAIRMAATMTDDDQIINLLTDLIYSGDCLFLLDGLDQVATDSQQRMLAIEVTDAAAEWIDFGNKVVVTSHLSGFDSMILSPGFEPYVLTGLDRLQIGTFIFRWARKLARVQNPFLSEEREIQQAESIMMALRQEMHRDARLYRLMRNPLNLRLLVSVYRTQASLRPDRTAIYQRFADDLVRRWSDAPAAAYEPGIQEHEAINVLSHLAFWLQKSRPSGKIDRENLARLLVYVYRQIHPEISDEQLRISVRMFIDKANEGHGVFIALSPGQYGFVFSAIQEYFAARFLVASYRVSEQRIRMHLHDPRWDNVIRLAVGYTALGSLDDATDLVETAVLARGMHSEDDYRRPSPFEELLLRDLFFAVDLLGNGIEMRSDLMHRLVGQIVNLWLHGDQFSPGRLRLVFDSARRYLVKLEGTSAGRYAWELARNSLDSSAAHERAFAIDMLTFWPSMHEQAVNTLTEMRREITALPPLVQRALANALGRMDSIPAEAYSLLLHFVSSPEKEIAEAGRQALKNLPPVPLEALGMWLNYLRSNDTLRRITLRVFGNIGTLPQVVIEELLGLLSDQDDDLRETVLNTLARITNLEDSALIAICRTAYTTNTDIQLAAIGALTRPVELPDEVIDYLIDWTNDLSRWVRQAASMALGACLNYDGRIINALIERLEDAADSLRPEIVGLLVKKAPDDSLVRHQLLRHTIRDPIHTVRCAVAEALIDLEGPRDELRMALNTLLSDAERLVRETALRVVARFPDPGEEIINHHLMPLAMGMDDELGSLSVRALAAQRNLSVSMQRRIVDDLMPRYWETDGEAIAVCLKRHRPLQIDVVNSVMDIAIRAPVGISADSLSQLRALALEVLGYTLNHSPDMINILINTAHNNADVQVKIAALRGLRETRVLWRDVRTMLVHQLRQDNIDVSCEAAITLGILIRTVPDPPFDSDEMLEIAQWISDLIRRVEPRAAWEDDSERQNELLHTLDWIVARARPGSPRLPAYSENPGGQFN